MPIMYRYNLSFVFYFELSNYSYVSYVNILYSLLKEFKKIHGQRRAESTIVIYMVLYVPI